MPSLKRENIKMLPIQQNTRSSLIIVDMQEFFFQKEQRRRNLDKVINNINKLISLFDKCALPVFHVVSCYEMDGSDWDLKMKAAGKPELIEGTQEAAILPDITVLKNHRTIIKTRYSAFFNTDLAHQLHTEKIERAVIVGAYTHYCINATVFDAYCHDFIPCMITDAVISHLKTESDMLIDRMRRNGYHLFSTDEYIAENGQVLSTR